MLEIFRLIRFRTIAFTAFTMYAMRILVVFPVLREAGLQMQLSEGDFSLLVVAVCCLVSAAYVVNDYFDTKADRISGSRPVVVGKTISRRAAITLHTVLNVVAVGIAFYLGLGVHHGSIVLLFLAISALLWLYSSRLKKRFLLGNLFVAFLTGLIPLAAITFEIPLLRDAYPGDLVVMKEAMGKVLGWTLWFSYLLFLNTLIYEINKDVFSVNGDRAEGIITLPVKWGVPATRTLLTGLSMVMVGSLSVLFYLRFIDFLFAGIYIALILIIPYVGYGVLVRQEGTMKLQLRCIRLLMLLCMLLSFFIPFMVSKNMI